LVVSPRIIPDKYLFVVGAVLLVAGLAGLCYSLVVLESVIREVSEVLSLAPRLGIVTGVVALSFASALAFALGLIAVVFSLFNTIIKRRSLPCL